ncbi:hypothetical protein R6Q59_020944 [Mikania micrantha]|uniref:Uncharacterized protein n=1 Tax=Mikania micrantha TaxID=192012 RepID=A0A5N6PPJ8_9ASTR|nr:hypothetical protein E3N88_06051 [Mikania micrantha]
MEMEQRTPLITKKLWGIIKSIIYMVKNSIPWFEIHMMLKRSTKIAGKAIGNLQLDHQTLSCRSNDIHTTFIAPIEYEFSCSNTPFFYPKRKNNRRLHFLAGTGGLHRESRKHRELNAGSVRKAFDVLNSSVEPEKSPLTVLGFGEGSSVRQLRVTDSPFPVSTEEGDVQVDKLAEEFIKNFYEELKLERNRTAGEPPSPFCYRRWGQVR